MLRMFCGLFAQCGRVNTPTLTLARYVLETSLMDYSYVSCHDSKMAAACLLLAMNMNCDGQWVRLQHLIFTYHSFPVVQMFWYK